jgi:hypothetical protein
MRTDYTCRVPGCAGPIVKFKHFPTVTGFCLVHGNVLTDFLSLVDLAPTVAVGFDATRERWRRGYNLLHGR